VTIGLIAGGLLVTAALWWLAPYAWRRHREGRLADLCRARRAIALTYDDGPGEKLTEDLLDLFKAEGAQATFFLWGDRARARPAVVARALAEGHEIGGHTQTHLNAWKSNPVSVAQDVPRGMATVRASDPSALMFRPPFGKITLAGVVQAMAQRLRFAWWTVDSRDAWARRPIEDVLAEIEAKGGGVVLMHDFDTYEGADNHGAHVLALTQRILELARERGYQVMRMGDLIGASG
jgi:peptidoglycan/xylan/chitin deacetylase (PgdA/CDA1 family)